MRRPDTPARESEDLPAPIPASLCAGRALPNNPTRASSGGQPARVRRASRSMRGRRESASSGRPRCGCDLSARASGTSWPQTTGSRCDRLPTRRLELALALPSACGADRLRLSSVSRRAERGCPKVVDAEEGRRPGPGCRRHVPRSKSTGGQPSRIHDPERATSSTSTERADRMRATRATRESIRARSLQHRLHADRAPGRHRDHRRADRAAACRRFSRPARRRGGPSASTTSSSLAWHWPTTRVPTALTPIGMARENTGPNSFNPNGYYVGSSIFVRLLPVPRAAGAGQRLQLQPAPTGSRTIRRWARPA